jgi:acyl-coenzyme A thioesterase PaaI-like protein
MRSETFEWAGPLVGPRVDTEVSGLAYLSGIRDGVVAPPQLGPLISAEIVEVARGRIQLICSPSDSQFGLLRELDPGVANLLVNTAIGCVARTLVGLRQGWATAESQVSYLRQVSPRVGSLTATAEVVGSIGARTLVKGELADDRGRVLTSVSTILDVFDLEAGPRAATA